MMLWRVCYFPLLSGVAWKVEALETAVQEKETWVQWFLELDHMFV